ncbi:MAG TPA: marine proteobacterial sortase target protein [Burkholderiales bacterium]|nr:marine proteobacterial sortase target protein [Burkholderiales bacterium]
MFRMLGPSDARIAAADRIAKAVLWVLTVLAVVATAGVLLLAAGGARASTLVPMKPQDAAGGTLLLKSNANGETFAVPLLATDVEIRVSGMVARAAVRQRFRNPHADWYEGTYVFPLPENAAVDRLRMRIGDRLVEGEIRERQAAKAAYERAKQSGQRATLLEQERPNIFTSSVANIGPGEEIEVELEYQQRLRYEQARYSLRFPMVVGPRYIPGTPDAALLGTGWAPGTDQVPDAARITPPVLRPRADVVLNPVTLRVTLDAGVPLAAVESAYHPVRVRETGPSRREVVLEGEAYATRDFELAWTVTPDRAPRVAFFTERRGERHYGLLMVMPPAGERVSARLPREVIFVIDTSGSMHGASILQAKEALELAVLGLGPRDRFNVIEFNSVASMLFTDARAAAPETTAIAVRWIRALKAQGGTEMAAAVKLALNARESPDRVRQVIFLTDGAVGNEDPLFRLIAERLGDSRLFTVGIGSAPNSHFMTKAAQTGRGTFTYIGRPDEVKQKMGELFAKLESPVLKDVRIEWPGGAQVESWPKRLPDLYLGEPVVVTAALARAEGEIVVSGTLGDVPWRAAVPVTAAAEGSGMGVLWARDKIAALMDSLRENAPEPEIRAAVVDLALTHHLVTKYTSLVAVDRAPARPDGAALKEAALPTNLPDGWTYDAVFGELPRGATDARFNLLLGALLLLAATLAFGMRRRFAS